MSRAAESDLEDISEYVAAYDSIASAARVLDGILGIIDRLESFPGRGHVPAELRRAGNSEFRQLLWGPYRIVYEVVGSTVNILLIADGRRDMQTLLERRLLDS